MLSTLRRVVRSMPSTSGRAPNLFSRSLSDWKPLSRDHQLAVEKATEAVSHGNRLDAVKAVREARLAFPSDWSLYIWEAKLLTDKSIFNLFGADPHVIDLVKAWYNEFTPENPAPKSAQLYMGNLKSLIQSNWTSDEVLEKHLGNDNDTLPFKSQC